MGTSKDLVRRPIHLLIVAGVLVLTLGTAFTAMALSVGARAPEIGLKNLRGETVHVTNLRGKVVLVDFWASWCAPCKEEIPVLERLHRTYRAKGLVVLGVSVDRDRAKMRDFLKKLSVSFPIVHDPAHLVAGRYQPARMPSSYLIDRRGVVRYVHAGFRSSDAKKLEKEVKALLQ